MNRTQKVTMGAALSLAFSLLQIFLSLWRTRVIILNLGTDIHSINAVSMQLLSYVGLLEGGIGAGFLYKMYAPMAAGDTTGVNRLYNGLRISMRKVACMMTMAMLLISFLYPLVMADNSLGYGRVVALLLLTSLRSVVPYFLSVHNKQLLILTENQHILTIIDGTINILIVFGEIVLVNYFALPFEFVLLMGIFFTIVTAAGYSLAVRYYLKKYVTVTREASFEGTTMTKDILVHKICYMANTHIDALILSFLDLFQTSVYTSYNSVVGYPTGIINKVMINLRGAIGIKLNSEATDSNESYTLFKEILALNVSVASVICTVFIVMINPFVTLWLGEEYAISILCCILFALNMFNGLLNDVIILMRDAKGLYKESKGYTLATAACNLVLSLVLVNFWGVAGLLFATTVSTYLIMDLGNNRLIFKHIFKRKMTIYWDYLLAWTGIAIGCVISFAARSYIPFSFIGNGWISFASEAAFVCVIALTVTLVSQGLFNPYFRRLVLRVKKSLFKK